MNKSNFLSALREYCAKMHAVNATIAVLDYDMQVSMPAAGAPGRTRQLTNLALEAHKLSTSEELGALLETGREFYANVSPEDDGAALWRLLERDYRRDRCVNRDYVEAFAALTGEAFGIWEKAKLENDFAAFAPILKRIFQLRREYSEFFRPYQHFYDPLLEDFEPGFTTAEVLKIFDALRAPQRELLQKIAAQGHSAANPLTQKFPAAAQWQLSRRAAQRIGFDFQRGRIDSAEHPFTTTFNLNDVRITTHIYEDNMASALYSTLHESGHAIYEQNIAPNLDFTVLGTGASLAVHESQSRLWENIVGRGRDFLQGFYPEIRTVFPTELASVSAEEFYRAVNRVEFNCVRTESDEATYNMHIMLRMELELALLDGSLEVNDLPEAWNAKLRDYLNITARNDSEGVLQDVHWATGAIGYFPTYLLGNLISVVIYETAIGDRPEIVDGLRRGECGSLREWLTGKLYRHGAKFTLPELLEKITGRREIDPQPYINYLNRKYGELYAL